jgi:OHCU decarboxylase
VCLSELNQLSDQAFCQALGGIYESSLWVAEEAVKQRPFRDKGQLTTLLRKIVDDSGADRQRALINAHPDLGGKLGLQRNLTEESTAEQSRLALDRLSHEEFTQFTELNKRYRTKFGFPFIICVGKLKDRAEVLTAFRARIENSIEEEFLAALSQIHDIAQLRLNAILPEDIY